MNVMDLHLQFMIHWDYDKLMHYFICKGREMKVTKSEREEKHLDIKGNNVKEVKYYSL